MESFLNTPCQRIIRRLENNFYHTIHFNDFPTSLATVSESTRAYDQADIQISSHQWSVNSRAAGFSKGLNQALRITKACR
ncbi:hypothetical protein ACROYT_G001460 [Oculina patagonica]